MYPGTHASRWPEKAAVIVASTGETLTYRDLDDRSHRLGRYLYDAGLRPGDHIALLTDNTPRAFEVYWAAMRSGLYITLVNRHLSHSEISYIVNDCDAQALITSAATADAAQAIVGGTPQVRIRLAYGGAVPHHTRYEDTLQRASRDPLPSQPCGADMLYSSGTTGRPKGIRTPLPDAQIDEHQSPARTLLESLFHVDSDSIYLSPAPIYHAAPLRFAGLVQSLGGTVVMMERFDAEQALAAIERYRATHSQWVPTMFVRMLQLPTRVRDNYDLSSLQVAVHAGAPCPVDVKQAMINWWGPILREYYSSTEGNGVTFIDSSQWLQKPGSVGLPVLGKIHICGDAAELKPGKIGSVYFEREGPAFVYHKDPVKTARAQHPEHPLWTTTGDIGYVDDDGFLYLTGRAGFTIISGGVNIYPQEIEDCLALHPKVHDLAVFGVPDDEMGESVFAVIQPAPDVVAGPELAAELRDFLRERIAHYKVPRGFDFVANVPRTPTGKLLKGQLRERYI